MDSEYWQRLGDLFEGAADLPPDQQRAYLDQACGGDQELRAELERMLGISGDIGIPLPDRIHAVIAAAAADANNTAQATERDALIGSFLGPYRVLSLLGRGGMGAVYRAEREDDQFRKQVAIKVIPRVLAGPAAVARFRAERQILANLEHPNIARLLDGGTADGVPYLVMEYIEGQPITRYVAEPNLSIADRVRLIRNVCAAVQFAHAKLVVHRDLKPANILVASDGTVKLLDFGVAKILDPAAADTSLTSSMMMTPDYASPEQIRGEPVSTAGDVYSLGVVLYEVLTGERPYRVTAQSPIEIEKQICDTEPRPPSEVEIVSRKMRRSLSGDLDNIVLMALRKDASRRYQSAEHLAEDLRRYLDGEPVLARPDTVWYRGSKFLQRNRWFVAAAVLVAASLVTGTIISVRQARVARQRFDQFRGFARTVLVDLHGQLSDIPGTSRARQALIAHVNNYLQGVVADNTEDDTALASEIATTYLRLGELQGVTREAIASYENGCKLLEFKRKNGSATTEDVLALARLRLRLGNTLVDSGKAAEGKDHLLTAYGLADQIVRTNASGISEAMKIKARAYWRVARIYRVQYKLNEAEQYSSIAVATCQDLVKRGVRDRELDEIHNGARLVLAGTLRRQGRWQQSYDLYKSVLVDNQRQVTENPASASLQRELARSHQILADMLARMSGRDEEVRTHVRSSIRIAEALLAPDPQDKSAQNELGQYLSSGAEALSRPEDRAEAEGYLRRAVPIFQSLLQREPSNGNLMLFAALTEAELGDAMGRVKPTRESVMRIRTGWMLLRKLVEREPGDTTNTIELFKVQRMLALNLARYGFATEAVQLSEDLITRAGSLSGPSAPQAEIPLRELPRSYALMGAVFRELGKPAQSRSFYQKAVHEWESVKARGLLALGASDELDEARKYSR